MKETSFVKRSFAVIMAVAAVTLVAAACGSSNSDSSRNASGSGCVARFGCATEPTYFRVVNNSDASIGLKLVRAGNVNDADRSRLSFDVAARSASPVLAVRLGDDGLHDANYNYIRGGFRGWWEWDLSSGSSVTPVLAELAQNWDYSDMAFGSFEGWSEVGASWPLHYTSQTSPVILTAKEGGTKWSAVGSSLYDWDTPAKDRIMSWTFTPSP